MYSWKRPFELSSNPSLYVDGTSRKDVIQGILGDCWLLSTCAAVAKREDLMHRVLDPKQVKNINKDKFFLLLKYFYISYCKILLKMFYAKILGSSWRRL